MGRHALPKPIWEGHFSIPPREREHHKIPIPDIHQLTHYMIAFPMQHPRWKGAHTHTHTHTQGSSLTGTN
eukprot:scaffold11078_cov145-Amphora_coffeaeformis.AAC.2